MTPKNPKDQDKFIIRELCASYRQKLENDLFNEVRLLNEKIKSIKNMLTLGFTVSSFIVVMVQFWLSLQ